MRISALAARVGWGRFGLIVGLGLFVGLGIQALVKSDAEWATVFVPAARDLLWGGDFYRAGTLYLYPPFGAMLALPFVALPDWAIRLAWYVIDVVALIALALASWGMTGGGRLAAPSRATARDWGVVAIGAAIGLPFAINTLAHQQVDLVIDAAVAVGCRLVLRGWSARGGALIALGAAIKGPPMLFLPYFLWRRAWVAALALAVTVVAITLLPDLVARGPEGTWVGTWLGRHVLPAMDVKATLGSWGTDPIYNQSLAGTVRRVAGTVLRMSDGRLRAVPIEGGFDNRTLKLFTYGVMAVLLATTLAASLLGERRRRAAGFATGAGETFARANEMAIVAILMLLFSPMSGLAHFPILLPAALVLGRMAVFQGDRVARFCLVPAIAAALALNKDLVGAAAYDTVLWAGGATIAALALWVGAVTVLARGRTL
jgi:hypothetical protein